MPRSKRAAAGHLRRARSAARVCSRAVHADAAHRDLLIGRDFVRRIPATLRSRQARSRLVQSDMSRLPAPALPLRIADPLSQPPPMRFSIIMRCAAPAPPTSDRDRAIDRVTAPEQPYCVAQLSSFGVEIISTLPVLDASVRSPLSHLSITMETLSQLSPG